jgi:DNA invertase Pin-like site-specific DNA recombinase
LAAVRTGDKLVVPKLDRLARSVPDARAIADELKGRGVKLQDMQPAIAELTLSRDCIQPE